MLSIISTPIGNLGDITQRGMETLRAVDAIVCEDTRVTGSLLHHLQLPKKELVSMHGYSDPRKIDNVIARLKQGIHIALVSDAGTPGISDPGYALVSRAREAGITIEAIPGPAAFLTALSVSGLPINRFLYIGFLPLKKGRKSEIASFASIEETIVLYESVHRIERTLMEIAEALKGQPERAVVVCRELTKMHEEIVQTTVGALCHNAQSITKKGEFVVVIGPKR